MKQRQLTVEQARRDSKLVHRRFHGIAEAEDLAEELRFCNVTADPKPTRSAASAFFDTGGGLCRFGFEDSIAVEFGLQRFLVGRPVAFAGVVFNQHGRLVHLGVEVIDIMHHIGLGRGGNPDRPEFERTMVADDDMQQVVEDRLGNRTAGGGYYTITQIKNQKEKKETGTDINHGLTRIDTD